MPPPGSSHQWPLVWSAGSDACSSRTLDWVSSRIKRAAWRLGMALSLPLTAPHGQDGHVVGERGGGEIPRRLEQRLAQRLGVLTVVSPQDAGDALLPEELLARAGLGQPICVQQEQRPPAEGQLPAVVGPRRVEREQRARRP